MRVLVVRNGSKEGGKEVRLEPGADLQALLKSASDVLALPFACLLYTPQGGLVDDISDIVPDDVLYVSQGEDFKNPAVAPAPNPQAVTLKNMFDESKAHLPSPGPALRKSVEQRLGLKTSTGGKTKADYEAAVLQVSEVFPTYELNMIIAAVTLAKCNLDNAIGMLMEPSNELIARKKLLDEVRGAKEKNAMRRSQEASLRASREKTPMPAANPNPNPSPNPNNNNNSPAPVAVPALAPVAVPSTTNQITSMPPPASRPLKTSTSSTAAAAMSANFPYKAEFEGLQRHAPPDHYPMIRSILLFTKGDVARTATLYAQWKAKQPPAPAPVVAPPAAAPAPKAAEPIATTSSAPSKFKIDWAPPSAATAAPAALAPTTTAPTASPLIVTSLSTTQTQPVELVLKKPPVLLGSSSEAAEEEGFDTLRDRCIEAIAKNWVKFSTSIQKLPPRLRMEVFERACILGAAEISDQPSPESNLSALLKRSADGFKRQAQTDEQLAKKLQKEQEEALSRRQIANLFQQGAIAPSQLSTPEALHIAAELEDAIPDDEVYVSLLGPMSLLSSDIRSLFSAGTLQKVLRQDVLARFRQRWNVLRDKIGAFYEVVPCMAFYSASMGALPSLIRGLPISNASPAIHLAADPTSCLTVPPNCNQTHISILVCAVLLGRPLYAPDARWSERSLAPGHHSHITSDERFAILFSVDAVAPCYALHVPVDIARDASVRFASLKRRTVPRVRPLHDFMEPAQ